MFIAIDSEENPLVNPPFLDAIKRRVGPKGDSLCCYIANGRFCVGRWINKHNGWVQEITSFGDLGAVTSKDIEFVEYWLSDRRLSDNAAARRSVASAARSYDADKDARLKERQAKRESLRKRKGIPEGFADEEMVLGV